MQSAQIIIPMPADLLNSSEVELNDVDLKTKISLPEKGLTGLFGYRYTSTVISKLSALFGVPMSDIKVWVDIKKKKSFRPSLEGLGETTILRTTGCKIEVIEELNRITAKQYKQRTGKNAPDSKTLYSQYPNDMVNAMIKSERFKHIQLVSYTIHTEKIGEVDVATIIDRQAINRVFVPEMLAINKIIVKKF